MSMEVTTGADNKKKLGIVTQDSLNSLAKILFGIYSNIAYGKVDLILNDYKYAVALDIGGGNCSGAYMPINSYSNPNIKTVFLDGAEAINKWSIIGYKSAGEKTKVKIGQQAASSPYTYDGYKCVPTDNNLRKAIRPHSGDEQAIRSVEELTEDYIEVLIDGIMENNEELKEVGRDKILFLVGHPSDKRWNTEQTQLNLMNIVRKAAGLKEENPVLTMYESNAAILYAATRVKKVAGTNNPLNGRHIIIIDLGAFSADITYIDRTNGAMKHAEISIELGAKSVDKNIAAIALQKAGYTVTNNRVQNMSYFSRQIKEERWSGTEITYPIVIDEKDFILTNDDIDSAVTGHKFTLSGDNIEDSYIGHLERFMDMANDEIFASVNGRSRNANERLDVDCIYVVGGASRMTPAFEMIKAKANSLWNISANAVWPQEITDVMMNEAVPYGMLKYFANALTVLTKTPELITKLETYIEDNFPKNTAGRLMAFTENSAVPQTMIEYLWNKIILPQMQIWSESETDLSGDDLNASILVEMKKPVHKTEIDRFIKKGVTDAIDGMKSDMSDILGSFIKALYNIDLNQVDYNDVFVNDGIQSKIDTVIADVSSKIVQNILNRHDWIYTAIGTLFLPVICFGLMVYGIGEMIYDKVEENKVKKMPLAEQEEYKKKKKEAEEKKPEEAQKQAEKKKNEENAKKRTKKRPCVCVQGYTNR